MTGSVDKPDEEKPNILGGQESPKAMSESQILEFMTKHGVKRIDWKNFVPGKPLLYVLPDQVRHDQGRYAKFAPDMRPCVVRVDNPIAVTDEKPGPYLETKGRVHYYTIRAGVPEYLSSGGQQGSYPILPENLFEANDTLFPPK